MTRMMELDEKLVEAIAHGSGAESDEAAVESALRTHLASRQSTGLRALFGTVEFDPQYDYKAMRMNRFQEAEEE